MSKHRLPSAVAFEAAENEGSNATSGPTMGDLIAERLSRRDLVKGLAAVTVAAIGPPATTQSTAKRDEEEA